MNECCKDPFSRDHAMFKDSCLLPHKGVINSRILYCRGKEELITKQGRQSLMDFADYHRKFGLHRVDKGWVFREWAPKARSIHIIGEMTGWALDPGFALQKKRPDGIWEGRFPLTAFIHNQLYRLVIAWDHGQGDRIPTAATRVVQDSHTLIFNAQVWDPGQAYQWQHPAPSPAGLFIYEAHVGMAQEQGRVGTYKEFETRVLPRIKDAGYTAIQLMAVQEHPYYGSFGYHVTSFFAPSSRFGTPEELKRLVDSAHGLGLRVFMDVVHSHAAGNEVEGLSRFDGTPDQFFHAGERGHHRLWDSRCFDYGKPMVVRFLLSNLSYWIEEFHMDGFRFDGVTSMLFHDHGVNRAFTCYDDYYGDSVDQDALAYLYLANRLVHESFPACVTIAEDVSGYPGMAAPQAMGGTGFDYRYAMGVPDFWIRLLKEFRDEAWPLGILWHELNSRREEEKTISYAESHDQALVGDKTLMMRLMGDTIYHGMDGDNGSITTVRAVALHKMIRLITLATAGNGYLNFMGNEFGHPEWIDFPSAANNWSYRYARRQWSLKDNPDLMFSRLAEFDRAMVDLAKSREMVDSPGVTLLFHHESDRVLGFKRAGLVFLFNFHPARSFSDYFVTAPPGKYRMVLDTDSQRFGGQGRLKAGQVHFTHRDRLSLYLPTRTAFVLEPVGGA
jgi:1,4-alpha-glucan branching enzyme